MYRKPVPIPIVVPVMTSIEDAIEFLGRDEALRAVLVTIRMRWIAARLMEMKSVEDLRGSPEYIPARRQAYHDLGNQWDQMISGGSDGR